MLLYKKWRRRFPDGVPAYVFLKYSTDIIQREFTAGNRGLYTINIPPLNDDWVEIIFADQDMLATKNYKSGPFLGLTAARRFG